MFSNVDFSPRYLRKLRPNIFFSASTQETTARAMFGSCLAGIALYVELNLPEQTGQRFKVTQSRSDGRTSPVDDHSGLSPYAHHSAKLLLGSHRSISSTLRDSFPSAPHRSFLLKERELNCSFDII